MLIFFFIFRNPLLERCSTETNTLIIRLNKLLENRPTDPAARKTHEQNTVVWLEGKHVKLCPECAKSFNIARRQHHCRLCGSIMCEACSLFFDIADAGVLIGTSEEKKTPRQVNDREADTLRICRHCLTLLLNRREMLETRIADHPMKRGYEKILAIKKAIEPEIPVYNKIIDSLYEGDSIYTVQDAAALRGKILREAEVIDEISKQILGIPCAEGSRQETLKKSMRLAMIRYIKEQLMEIPAIPDEEDIKKLQDKRRNNLRLRIERERRLALEAYERYELVNSTETTKDAAARGSAVRLGDNFIPGGAAQDHTHASSKHMDPLVQQINIVKGYIKQAREAMKFEEVGTLELNLRELQQEYYRRQQDGQK